MQVLFPAVIVLVPVHGFLAGKSCILMRAKALALAFCTKDNILLTPHPSYSSAIDLFSLFDFTFIFDTHPRPHLPYIEPTSTLHGPHTDPTPTTTTFLLFSLHHHISTAFFPPPPPPPTPHFYCFSSTTTTTFLLFSFFTIFPLFFPPLPPHFYCSTSSL